MSRNVNMADEDKTKEILGKIKELPTNIDHKALAGAVGVMLMSWLGLPIVYWLIVRRSKEKEVKTK